MMKNRKLIVVISVEGNKSYTEVNFFNGIVNWKHGLDLISFGLHKSAREKTKQKNNYKISTKLEQQIMNHENIIIFFIGDGDVQKDIPSMKTAEKEATLTIDDLNYNKATITYVYDLFPADKKFEEEIKFWPVKEESNVRSFNDFCDNKGMYNDNNELNIAKLLEYFQETVYDEIFREIFED
ncbi:MAG: hypothetical protein KAG14_00735 [Mycoplasmataceae bacterium]|nr:hypothetical protein [Mycoplasmataceae bacterium]